MPRPIQRWACIAVLLLAGAGAARAQGPGESMRYRIHAGALGTIGHGTIGHGTIGVERADTLRGRAVWVLASELSARVLFARLHDRHRSWYDPAARCSLRFWQDERATIGFDSRATYDFYPAERRWRDAEHHREGPLPSATPLDELSYLFYARSLPLAVGRAWTVANHFEPEKNPVRIEVVAIDTVTVPAGQLPRLARPGADPARPRLPGLGLAGDAAERGRAAHPGADPHPRPRRRDDLPEPRGVRGGGRAVTAGGVRRRRRGAGRAARSSEARSANTDPVAYPGIP